MTRNRLAAAIDAVHLIGLAALLSAGAVLFFVLPKQTVSADEKRALTQAPAFSVASVLSGAYSRGLEAFYSDNFEFRDTLLTLADGLKAARGLPAGDAVQVFETPTRPAPTPSTPADPAPPTSRGAPSAPTVAVNQIEGEAYETLAGVVVAHGRAVQMPSGSSATAGRFAELVNRFHRALGPEVRIFCMAIPVGSDFYLPREIGHGRTPERRNIAALYGRLDPAVTAVDAYDALAAHTDEYIQFRTDHHWTGLGAYYAYQAFARAAGFEALPLSALSRGDIPNFLGSLYFQTRSEALKANPDHVEFFRVPQTTRMLIYDQDMIHGHPGRLYQETVHGSGGYGVFMAGDHPLAKVVSSAGTGRKILVIKDSYGDAFVPYLAAHYDEIYVVDYRYFHGDLRLLMRLNGVHELLFAHNTYVLNAPYTVSRGQALLADAGA